MKTCTKCGESKPISEFHKDAIKRDGLCSHCKECDSIAEAAWRVANAEKIIDKNAKWRAANADKARAAYDNWRAANPGKANEASAKWRGENPEACRIHHHNRRARERKDGGRLSKGLAERLFKLQRGRCACGCKKPLGTNYHMDHQMPLALGGTNTDNNMQLLRSTCNQQKHAKHPVEFMQSRGFLL